MKTSHAVKLSSCGLLGGGFVGGEGDLFVVVLAGGQAVVQAAEEPVEQVWAAPYFPDSCYGC
jgi:hypothetical protein